MCNVNDVASLAEKLKLVVHPPVAPVPELRVAHPSALFESTQMPTGFEFCSHPFTQVTEPEIVPVAACAGAAIAKAGVIARAATRAAERNLFIHFPDHCGQTGCRIAFTLRKRLSDEDLRQVRRLTDIPCQRRVGIAWCGRSEYRFRNAASIEGLVGSESDKGFSTSQPKPPRPELLVVVRV